PGAFRSSVQSEPHQSALAPGGSVGRDSHRVHPTSRHPAAQLRLHRNGRSDAIPTLAARIVFANRSKGAEDPADEVADGIRPADLFRGIERWIRLRMVRTSEGPVVASVAPAFSGGSATI